MSKKKITVKIFSPRVLSKYTKTVNPEAKVVCPVVWHLLTGPVVRCIVAITKDAQVQITVPLDVFNELPSKEVEVEAP